MKVPFNDLNRIHRLDKIYFKRLFDDIIDNSDFIGGELVEKFERDWAAWLGVDHCAAVANGTDALYLALKASGVGIGDEVIVPGMTWVSSISTIVQVGATPVIVDVEKDYYTIDPLEIEEAVSEKTKAVIAVHLYGQACDMSKITSLCNKYGLILIEDCAQSHGTFFLGAHVGVFGDYGTFSHYPGKNLGAFGDAGSIIARKFEDLERVKKTARHGGLLKHQHELFGVNSRLDPLHAGVLSIKLKRLEEWNEERRRIAEIYGKELTSNDDLELPRKREGTVHSYHVYSIGVVTNKEALTDYLIKRGIQVLNHYPRHLGQIPIYAPFAKNILPIATSMTERNISIPLFPGMLDSEINYVVESIKSFYK
jgi:dTDP-4-amino-4,6-dideoxygalactose transaminase